jgi:hypothetical protein
MARFGNTMEYSTTRIAENTDNFVPTECKETDPVKFPDTPQC